MKKKKKPDIGFFFFFFEKPTCLAFIKVNWLNHPKLHHKI